MSDKDWERVVIKAKTGDTDAFITLYETVYVDLYKAAFYTLQNKEDAEDIVSETVLDAYTGISKLRDPSAFRGWIFKILSNKCKQKIKEYQKKRSQEALTEEHTDNLISLHAEQPYEQVLQQYDLTQAMEHLSPEERLILSMSAFGNYTTKEISKIIKKPHSTIRSKYHRSLKKLEKWLRA